LKRGKRERHARIFQTGSNRENANKKSSGKKCPKKKRPKKAFASIWRLLPSSQEKAGPFPRSEKLTGQRNPVTSQKTGR